ncbi:UNVERIFIED_CONTAM: hypothetical protein RMT77_009695 [Armadillidium vulgare]
MSDDCSDEEESKSKKVIRSAVDLQRIKLEKLMKNPEKPAFIPNIIKEKKFPDAPEFVRNVMGSSAGAGSGEFHVYRHIRRREYSRNLYLHSIKDKQELNEEHHKKLEEYKKEAEAKTAKKRAKRQKLKMKKRLKRLNKNKDDKKDENSESESESNQSESENEIKNDDKNENDQEDDVSKIR